MEVLVMAGQLLLGLSLLVLVHEWGHYITARWFGMRVEKFYIFFDAYGKKLFSFKRGDTEYGMGWLPFGGYVKIAGMIDESMDTNAMKQAPQPWEFRSKPAWQRLIVMTGGVIVNVIVGILIFAGMAMYYGKSYLPASGAEHGIVAHSLAREIGLQTGDKIVSINGKPLQRFDDILSGEVILGSNTIIGYERNGTPGTVTLGPDFADKFSDAKDSFLMYRFEFEIGMVSKGANADKAGLEVGDKILTISGVPIRFYDELKYALLQHKGKTIDMEIEREGKSKSLKVEVDEDGKIGFQARDLTLLTHMQSEKFGLWGALKEGANSAGETFTNQMLSWGKIFRGEVRLDKAVQGPMAMAQLYGGVWIWQKFWALTGLISLILAFMNILPIPALDGGHVIFTLVEMIKGSPVSDKVLEKAQIVGMVLVFGLMIFAVFNDIIKTFIL